MAKEHLKYESTEIDRRLDLAGTALQEHQDIGHLATKDEVVDGLATKENVIEDLAEIRSGAALGATAIQEHQDISNLATKKEVSDGLAKKVDNVSGKQLSTEDYTTAEKTKLRGLYNYDDATIKEQINSIQNTIPTNVSQLVNDKGYLTKHQDISHLATKDELIGKVDKEPGKQLTTEDFTTVLKAKLEGLNNYDDTVISSALNTLRKDLDAIVSGDTTSAIKTFNEVIAFLEGIQDTQDLSNIIAAIEQQIASVYNAIPANISQLNNDSGFIAQVKTINGESIEGEGDIVIKAGGDTTSLEKVVAASITDLDTRVKKLVNEDNKIRADVDALQNDAQTRATKAEVGDITTEIKSNERVTAAAINNLYETKADKAYVDDAIISAITNTLNTEV